MRLLPWGYLDFHLYLYLFYYACMFNSFGISAQVCRCACMFNSLELCAWVLPVLTHEGVLGEWSIGDDKGELTREYDLLETLVTLRGAFLLGKNNLLRNLVMILTYGEVLENVWSIGEDFLSFFMAYWGTCVGSTHEGVSSTLWGLFSSQLTRGLPLYLGLTRDSLHDIVPYWGFVWKFEPSRSSFGDLWFIEGCSWCFQSAVDASVVFMSLT